MSQTKAIRESAGDKIFLVFIYVFLGSVLLIVLYPLVYIFSSAFSSAQAVTQGKVWLLPVSPSVDGFIAAFKDGNILMGYFNSLFYTVVGTIVNVVLTIMLAYPLSRKSFYGRSIISLILAITLFFSGGLIPYYLVTDWLGLVDSRWSQIIPSAIAVWQVIIARTFFQSTIPDDLAEAAAIDGCSDFRFIIKMVLPLSKPIIAVLTLMYAVGHWNNYFDALIFIQSPNLEPLQIVLRNILILNSINSHTMVNVQSMIMQEGLINLLKFSVIVIASAPILLLYPFVQKHFVKGVTIGALKG